MTRVGRALLGTTLLAVAAAAGLLAVDALRWRGHLERAEAVYAAGSPEPAIWRPDAALPGRPAERLLALEDDVEFRRVLQRFRLARNKSRTLNLGLEGKQLLSETEFELARLIRREQDPVRRSHALALAAVLLFEGAQSQGVPADIFLVRTYDALREAARLDPANEVARDNLEVLVRTALPLLSIGETIGEVGGRSHTPGSSGASQLGEGW